MSEEAGMAVGTRRSAGPFIVRSTEILLAETGEEHHTLKRAVGALDLTALGVGAIIGTGIFVVVGEGATLAGPGLILSFMLAAVTCLFSALSYAELASSIPVAGSAYTYTYATLGEVVAWIIGWDLILEYGISVAAVAVGWGGNLNSFLDTTFGFQIPKALATSPESGGTLNLPAVLIVAVVTALLIRGVRETARTNTVMVFVKLGVLALFIVVGVTVFKSGNLRPFAPHGAGGIVSAAAVIFFAYIGFDAVSTGSEEAKKPSRDLPLAITGSLVLATIVYILVSVVAVGVLPASQLGKSDAPLADALRTGAGIGWASSVTAFGALVAITSVMLTVFYGQTRIMFAMSRDGLIPERLAEVSPRTGTPVRLTLLFGVLIAVLAAVIPLSEIVKLVNIGTLFAFILVNAGVIILRRTRPEMPRPFRVPFSPVFPGIGIALCLYLMARLPLTSWIRFFGWLLVGMLIYVFYGYRHSRLRRIMLGRHLPATRPAGRR
jgi:basic amino acid/polyamine antiporter, APA family